LSADEAAICDTPAARATSRSVGAALRRRVFGGVVESGFFFEVGNGFSARAMPRAVWRAAEDCSPGRRGGNEARPALQRRFQHLKCENFTATTL